MDVWIKSNFGGTRYLSKADATVFEEFWLQSRPRLLVRLLDPDARSYQSGRRLDRFAGPQVRRDTGDDGEDLLYFGNGHTSRCLSTIVVGGHGTINGK